MCSIEFDRDTIHGPKRASEKESFAGTTVRRGSSSFQAPQCVKDALTFLYVTRREMGQGRVPPGQSIVLGGLYPIHLDYAGEQTIKMGDQQVISDKLNCSVTTAHSEIRFEVYFARDAARTPLMIKVPFAIGTFTMELVR